MNKINHKLYLRLPYIKDGLLNLFFNIHIVILLGVITTILFFGIITAGPAIIALGASMRKIAQNDKMNFKYYFKIFKEKFIFGMFFDIPLFLVIISLSIEFNDNNLKLLSQIGTMLMICFFLYFPIASLRENKIQLVIKNSFYYLINHLLQTIFVIGFLYLLLIGIAYTSQLLIILFLPFGLYVLNRIILANNIEIDLQEERQE